MEEKNRSSYRSIFWPVLLIGVGIIWLLGSLNLIPDPSLSLLFRLWPLALVVIGLDILIGRRSPVIGSVLAVGSIVLIIALLFLAPTLGYEPQGELKTLRFNEPIDGATSANIRLDLERYPTTIYSLPNSAMLFEAELDTMTDVSFTSRGNQERIIRLEPTGDSSFFNFDWVNLFMRDARWDIGLSPDVPMDLYIDVGSGSAALDLKHLELTSFEIDGGSGSSDLALPPSGSRYAAVIDGGSGRFDIEIAENADVSMNVDIGSGSFNLIIGQGADVYAEINGGSGSLKIAVPRDVGVRVVVQDRGSGSVRLPASYDLVDDIGDDDRDTGIWESDGYGDTLHHVEIIFNPSSGSFTLR